MRNLEVIVDNISYRYRNFKSKELIVSKLISKSRLSSEEIMLEYGIEIDDLYNQGVDNWLSFIITKKFIRELKLSKEIDNFKLLIKPQESFNKPNSESLFFKKLEEIDNICIYYKGRKINVNKIYHNRSEKATSKINNITKDAVTLEYAKNKGFTYNPITGEVKSPYGRVCRWKFKMSGNWYLQCTTLMNGRYTKFFSHRFAWYYMTGEIPNIIDHHEHTEDPQYDNRFENLSNGNSTDNNRNSKGKGYCRLKDRDKWMAYITVDYKNLQSIVDTEQEAIEWRKWAKEFYHKDNKGRNI